MKISAHEADKSFFDGGTWELCTKNRRNIVQINEIDSLKKVWLIIAEKGAIIY